MGKKARGSRSSPDSFSVTNVKLALECPRKFYLCKFTGQKPFPYSGMILGSIVHNVIDTVVKKLANNTNLDAFMQASAGLDIPRFKSVLYEYAYGLYYDRIKDFPTRFKNSEEMEKSIQRGWNLLLKALDAMMGLLVPAIQQYQSKEAFTQVFIANELAFEINIPEVSADFKLTGRIDSLWNDIETKTPLLIDFKTGPVEKIATDFCQIALYAHAIWKKLGFKPNYALFYLKEDQIEEKKGSWFDLESILPNIYETIREMREWAADKNKCHKIETQQACGYCHLYQVCKRQFQNDPPLEREQINLLSATANDHVAATGSTSPPRENAEIAKMPSSDKSQEVIQVLQPEPEFLRLGELLNAPGSNALLDVKPLNRHVAILGTPGSGKTVLAKAIIEELLLHGYSAILIDPQGDLCSLLIPSDDPEAESLENVNFKIFTPGSKKGVPMRLDLFEAPPAEVLGNEDSLKMLLDQVSVNILNILGIDMKRGIPNEKPLLEILIYKAWQEKKKLTFQALADLVAEVDEIKPITSKELIPVDRLISKRDRVKLSQKLTSLSAGTEGYLFSEGESLDISKMLEASPSCYIINLQGLGSDMNKRQLVLSWIGQQIYNWMLTHPQANQDALRFLFYIDEVADFLPIHPNNPPSKKLLSALIRQARKYGVGMMIATQSPGSIDYKILDDVNTIFVGKTPTEQSAKKIQDLIRPYLESNPLKFDKIMREIRKSNVGEFFVITQGPLSSQFLHVRKLYTKHENVGLDRIDSLLSKDTEG